MIYIFYKKNCVVSEFLIHNHDLQWEYKIKLR